jgi:hypothetical protein
MKYGGENVNMANLMSVAWRSGVRCRWQLGNMAAANIEKLSGSNRKPAWRRYQRRSEASEKIS